MSQNLISTLSTTVSSAHRILETIVVRAQNGTVFTLEIGEALLADAENPYGAKATQIGNPDIHLGVCEGSTIVSTIRCALLTAVDNVLIKFCDMTFPPY